MDSETIQIASTATLLNGELCRAVVSVTDGIVESVALEQDPGDGCIDLGGAVLAPAPLDLHLHGAGGVVVPPSGSCCELDDMLHGFARSAKWAAGPISTSYEYVATLPVPARPPADPVEHVRQAAEQIVDSKQCLGIRLEGLFLNHARAGVWPPETFVAPDISLANRLIEAAAGAGSRLLIVDVAPELPGAISLIEHLVERGVVVSMAHTDATWDEAMAAIDAGATLATHVFNAMRPIHHRDPGVIAASLMDPRVTCEVICDGEHVHPAIISLVARCSRWCAISDASPFAGAGVGSWEWCGLPIHGDGRMLRDDRGVMAGSAMLLTDMLDVCRQAGMTQQQLAMAVAVEPRQVLDSSRETGLMVGDRPWVVPSID